MLTLFYPQNHSTDTVYPIKSVTQDQTGTVDYLAVLQKVIAPWQEHEVTWKNQPETTTEHQVFIPRIYYITDASCNCIVPPVSESVDVTKLLMPDAAGTRHMGLLLKLVKEEYPDWLRFVSSDYQMPTVSNQELAKLWPKLEIYYSLPTL